jgi:hypothetical protein
VQKKPLPEQPGPGGRGVSNIAARPAHRLLLARPAAINRPGGPASMTAAFIVFGVAEITVVVFSIA